MLLSLSSPPGGALGQVFINIITLCRSSLCIEVPSACACQVASVVSDSLRPTGLQPTRLLCPWDSPGKNTGMSRRALLQRSPHSVQPPSRVGMFATPWTAARQVSLSIANSGSVLKLLSIQSVMPFGSRPLSSPSPPAFNLSQHQGLFQ